MHYRKTFGAKDVENARAAVKAFAQPSGIENALLHQLQETNDNGQPSLL